MNGNVDFEILKDNEEYPTWVLDLCKSIGISMFVASQQNDTSQRQAYILIDNALELFLNNYLNYNKLKRNKNNNSFDIILDDIQNVLNVPTWLINNISENHKTRNIIYHKSSIVSVSLIRIIEYMDQIYKLGEIIGYPDLKGIVFREYESSVRNLLNKQSDSRYFYKQRIEEEIKENFELPANEFHGDIMLVSPIGISLTAVENFKTVFHGMNNNYNDKVRILELVEGNQKVAYHSFFISNKESNTWYCFIDSMWSHFGEGNNYEINLINEFLNDYRGTYIYKKSYIRKGMLLKAFDTTCTDEFLKLFN